MTSCAPKRSTLLTLNRPLRSHRRQIPGQVHALNGKKGFMYFFDCDNLHHWTVKWHQECRLERIHHVHVYAYTSVPLVMPRESLFWPTGPKRERV